MPFWMPMICWRYRAHQHAEHKFPSAIKNAPPISWRGVFIMSARTPCANYFADIKATVVSSMRFEKPHSLSYHDDTLTRRPDTLVSVESKMLDAGLWLKSTETSTSV